MLISCPSSQIWHMFYCISNSHVIWGANAKIRHMIQNDLLQWHSIWTLISQIREGLLASIFLVFGYFLKSLWYLSRMLERLGLDLSKNGSVGPSRLKAFDSPSLVEHFFFFFRPSIFDELSTSFC